MFDNFVIEEKEDSCFPDKTPEPEIISPAATETQEELPAFASETLDAEFEEASEPAPVPEVSYTQEELDEKIKIAEQNAYENGFKSAQSSIEASLKEVLSDINNKLVNIITDADAMNKTLEQQSMDVVMAVVRKLVPTLEAENALDIVNKFISENFNNFKNESKLSFYIHPDIISYVQKTIAALAKSHDFEGKIALHKDSSLAVGDCRVEWENGGVERNGAEMLNKVAEIVENKPQGIFNRSK